MKVKICGIFQEKTLFELKENNIWPDYLGFVLASSKRQVSTDLVSQWIKHLPENVTTVGVYVNPSLEDLAGTTVDVIQLHGEEGPHYCQLVKDMTGKKIWKVIPVKQNNMTISYQQYLNVVDGFVFDTVGPNRGGNGLQFEWEALKEDLEKIDKPVLIAGGIKKTDISRLKYYSVEGIDLSSGVEINGLKSVEKIIEVLEEARK